MFQFQFIPLFCADPHHKQLLSQIESQRLCMQRFINPDIPPNSAVDQSGLQHFIHLCGGDAYDPCTWNGVHCTNKVLERIRIDMIGRAFGVVDLEWLPPTVRFFSYSRSRILRRWTASRLPRALRFFRLWTCLVGVDGMQTQPLDLEKLPSQMEELHLFRVSLRGQIHIGRLPETMRVVDIGDHNIRNATVDFEGLPENLFSMSITHNRKSKVAVKIVGIGAVQKDRRVTNRIMSNARSKPVSKYQNMFPH